MNELVVFAKYWEPGHVKTRLAQSIGDDQAANIYRHFLDCTLARFQHLGDRRTICVAPAERKSDFERLQSTARWAVTSQSPGDLGERMRHMFDDTLRKGHQVVLIGSDSPDLPIERIDDAFGLLAEHDVVLGPTSDGGYYLLGLSQFVAELFVEMPWSTPQLWQRTMERLNENNRTYATLSAWSDVDDYDDLTRLRTSLEQSVDRINHDPALKALYHEVCAILQSHSS